MDHLSCNDITYLFYLALKTNCFIFCVSSFFDPMPGVNSLVSHVTIQVEGNQKRIIETRFMWCIKILILLPIAILFKKAVYYEHPYGTMLLCLTPIYLYCFFSLREYRYRKETKRCINICNFLFNSVAILICCIAFVQCIVVTFGPEITLQISQYNLVDIIGINLRRLCD